MIRRAIRAAVEFHEQKKAETLKELSKLHDAWDVGRNEHGQDGYTIGYDDAVCEFTEDLADVILKYGKELKK